MAHKTIAKILVVLALVSGCTKKSNPENKPKDSTGAALENAAGSADSDGSSKEPGGAAGVPGSSATSTESGAGGGAQEQGQEESSGEGKGARGATPPGVPPKPLKWLVVTVGMGPQDLDVVISPDKTPWRISMKPTAGELAPIAARAKASPDAVDGQVMLAVGNSVPPEAAKALFDALKTVGFKKATMEVARRP
jgi:hypothetical protein